MGLSAALLPVPISEDVPRSSMLTAVMILPEARPLGDVNLPVVDEQGRQQLTVGVAARNAAADRGLGAQGARQLMACCFSYDGRHVVAIDELLQPRHGTDPHHRVVAPLDAGEIEGLQVHDLHTSDLRLPGSGTHLHEARI
jgi:hypothetical protein